MIQATKRKREPPNPRRLLSRRIAAAWRPKERIPTDEWVAKNCRLPAEFGTPGRFDLEDFPYWREVLQALDDPDTFEITLMAGTQIGKTETLKAILQSQADVNPGPQMFVGPDKDYILENREKIYRAAELNPVLRKRIPPESRRNARWLSFGNCYCYLGYPKNTQKISGKAVKLIMASELDRYDEAQTEGAIVKLITERVKSFMRYKIIWESTPQDENSKIADKYDDSDQRRWHVPCPHCGEYQSLQFYPHKEGDRKGLGGIQGLKNEDGSWKSKDEVRESAYYCCEVNGCRIGNESKMEMMSRGVWVPKGQHVTKQGKLAGKPLQSARHRGYQLWSIMSPAITFGDIAAEYLDSREDIAEMMNFINNWLGERFLERASVPHWKQLGARVRGTHRRGVLPPGVVFLTAAADKQQDRAYWVIRGWGENRTSWLIDFGMAPILRDANGHALRLSDLDQLQPLVLDQVFPYQVVNPWGWSERRVTVLGVDSGNWPAEVWEWVSRYPEDRVRAIAGSPHAKLGDPLFAMNVVEKNERTGKPYPGGFKRWALNVNHFKLDLLQRWEQPLDQAGAWFVTDDPPENLEDYLRQVTNEGQVPIRDKRTNKVKKIWKTLESGVGNHYWDCEVYNMALAEMIVDSDWSNLAQRFRPVQAAQLSRTEYRGLNTPDGQPFGLWDRHDD